jgi:integrase
MPEVITQALVDSIIKRSKRIDVTDLKTTGLVLRGYKTGAVWAVRADRNGKTYRVTIGSPPDLSLANARKIAAKAFSRLKDGLEVDFRWIESQKVELGLQTEIAAVMPIERVRASTWTYEDAVAAYLVGRLSSLKEHTLTTYRQKLTHPALRDAFYGVAIVDIERRHASKVVEEVAIEHSTTAENMVGALGRLWDWMSRDSQQALSGIKENTMLGLKAPERPIDRKKGSHIKNPEMENLGRIVAACHSDVLHPSIARALEIIVLTAQRRETVASAWISEIDLDHRPPVWMISGKRMKMGADHWIPLPARAVEVFRQAIADAREIGSEFVFPQVKPKKTGADMSHVHPDTLSHYMSFIGDRVTPHRIRIAFTSNSRIEKEQAALVLDHMENRTDVTSKHYDRKKYLLEKGRYLTTWQAVLRPHIARAEKEVDPAAILDEIRRRKREVAKNKRPLLRDQMRERVRARIDAEAAGKAAIDQDRRIAEEALEALRDGRMTIEEVRHRLRLDA